jgi:LacI family transcriptional regulator
MTSTQMVSDIRALGIPVAAIDVYPHLDDTYAVETDNVQGAKLATNHLIELGHRKLGFLFGSVERFSIAERERGFREALDGAGIAYSRDEVLFDCVELDHCAAYARAKQLLARADRPTGIFCANDEVGAGALRAAYELGVRVPEQLSVIGFDDITMCNFTNPPLSTVGIDKEAMGRQAVKGLMQAIETKAPIEPPARMGVQLVTRASTGPAPPARGRARSGQR